MNEGCYECKVSKNFKEENKRSRTIPVRFNSQCCLLCLKDEFLSIPFDYFMTISFTLLSY